MTDFIGFLKANKYIVSLLILGVVLMILPKISNGNIQENVNKMSDDNIEKKIESIIKSTYSLNDVSVLITYDTYGEKILEYDYVESSSGGDQAKKSYEKNFITNENSKTPFVKSEKLPGVRGVLVSAKDANEQISMEIKYAVATLLGTKINKVHVIY